MCETCGCHDSSTPRIVGTPAQYSSPPYMSFDQDRFYSVGHTSAPEVGSGKKDLLIERNILEHNQVFAERNRDFFLSKNIFALNLVSSPGSGKTALIEALVKYLNHPAGVFVVEGDQQSTLDAERIEKLNVPVVQINTGSTCHLDADIVGDALRKLNPTDNSLVIIENVGNLMCPSLFDLGETLRIVLLSTAEGDDKPLKYPFMFNSAQACMISKIDLLPYTGFDITVAINNLRLVNPHIIVFELSSRTGEGMVQFVGWLEEHLQSKQ